MRIAAYIRVSTEEQKLEGHSIEAQQELIKRKCEELLKTAEIDFFIDEGKSASNLKRPALQELIDHLDYFHVLFVWKLNRLSRSLEDRIYLFKVLEIHQIKLVSIMEQINMTNASGKLALYVQSAVDQYDLDTIKENTKMGYVGKAAKGEYPFGRAPWGYLKNKEGKLVPNPKFKQIIEDIYYYFYELHYNKRETSFKLSEKYRQYSFKQIEKKVDRVLTNKVYMGIFEYLGYTFDNIIEEAIIDKYYEYKQKERNKYKYIKSDVFCSCGRKLENKSTKKVDKHYTYKYCPKCNKRINEDKLKQLIYKAKGRYALNDLNYKKNYRYYYDFNNNNLIASLN